MPLDGIGFVQTVEIPVEIPLPMRETDTSRVLQEALRLVKRGWCKKCYATCGWLPVPTMSWFATNYCVYGAIRRAGSNLNLPIGDAVDAMSSLISHMHRYGGGGQEKIFHWNDDRLTTKSEVMTGLGCAIINTRQGG